MKGAIAVITAFMLVAPAVWTVETMAQTQKPGMPAGEKSKAPGAEQKAPGAEQEVQGKIMSVDPSGKVVTLEDGTKLMIPDGAKVKKGDLKQGTSVKARYKEENGQKVVTRIELRPAGS